MPLTKMGTTGRSTCWRRSNATACGWNSGSLQPPGAASGGWSSAAIGIHLGPQVGAQHLLRLGPDEDDTVLPVVFGLVFLGAVDPACRVTQVQVDGPQQAHLGGAAAGEELKAYHRLNGHGHERQRGFDVLLGHGFDLRLLPCLPLAQTQPRDGLQVKVDAAGEQLFLGGPAERTPDAIHLGVDVIPRPVQLDHASPARLQGQGAEQPGLRVAEQVLQEAQGVAQAPASRGP